MSGGPGWRGFIHKPAAWMGLSMLGAVLFVTIAGPWLWPDDPFELRSAPFTPPFSAEAWLGSDQLGRDVFTELMHGGRVTLFVGAMAALLSMAIGVLSGALAGYYGGWADALLMRVAEFFQVLPALLFAMVLTTLFLPTLTTVTLAIAVVIWPGTARLARAEFLRLRGLDFVRSQQAIGAPDRHVLWRVMLPNAAAPLVVSSTLAMGVAILFESGLAFLGLGDPNRMSWGLMIGSARLYVLDCWWAVTFPGLAIFLSVLSVSLIGDAVSEAFDPRRRGG